MHPILDGVLNAERNALFNPAFCAALVNKACASFVGKAQVPLPLAYVYIILPSALHKPSRDQLPSTTAASMWPWIRDNPLLFADISERVITFRVLTSEAIVFGLRQGVLHNTNGGLTSASLKRRPRSLRPTADWGECMKAADFLGRWFAASDSDQATTLAHWGFRP